MNSLNVTGMTCGSCVARVQKRLQEHPAVLMATVTLTPPAAEIEFVKSVPISELNDWLTAIGDYHIGLRDSSVLPEKSATTYRPLLIILAYLILVTASVLIAQQRWDTMLAMRVFMGGFFITFSFFKLLNLQSFSQVYRSYDIVAKVWPNYGLIYPFIELGLGLAYIAHLSPQWVNLVTILVMSVSLVGVVRAVLAKHEIRCACLGTFFQLPMSTVTLVEDGLMLAMAVAMLLAD